MSQLVFNEGLAAATPATGKITVYAKTDGLIYSKDDTGVETPLGVSGGGSGDVVGPASATDNAVVRFDGTTGKLIQDSAVTIADTTGDITAGKYNTVAISGSSTPTLAVTGTTTVSGTNTGDQVISDATLTTSDITTNNFTTAKHGFVPKGTNVGNFLKDDGTWASIPGGGDALTSSPLSQFASTTSAQLAGVMSDETGTGALVFANTPTLVTPILGTPTSGNLANCTFPTLNQNTTGTASNVTGTVAVANGGTGGTTAADARTNLGLVIGTNVQAYDVDTAKLDVVQTFTVSQRGAVTTDNDLSFDLSVTNNFKCTPTAGGTLTFTNLVSGQSGYVLLVNSSNYAITAAATTKVGSTLLSTISATGTYLVSYLCDGTNVYCTASGALS